MNTDFFAATDAELSRAITTGRRIDAREPLADGTQTPGSSGVFDSLPTRRMKNVDPVALDCLCAALKLDTDIPSVFPDPVSDEASGGPVVLRLHDALVLALARLDSSEVESAAREWAAALRADFETIADATAREQMLASVTDADRVKTLESLATLAVETLASGRTMYLELVL